MENLVDLGRVRALGVSNFGIQELEALWSFARVKPVYVQNIFKIYKCLSRLDIGDNTFAVGSHNSTVIRRITSHVFFNMLKPDS